MTAWTHVTSFSSFFGSAWVADLGVYTGPTVDMPPPPFLPANAIEIDFTVGTPNPDGLVADFHDGSYSEPDGYYQSGRYRDVAHTGAEIAFDGGPITSTGQHLMVSWYGDHGPEDFTPAITPESLVPVGWTAGGTLDIGHWSAWHDGDVAAVAITDIRNGTIYSTDVIQNNTPSTDAAAAMDTVLATARTGTTHIGYSYQPLDAHLITEKFAGDVSPAYQFTANASLSQEMLTLVTPAAPALAPPAGLFDGLTEGIDYAPDPYTGDLVTYESTVVALGFADFPIKTVGGYSEGIVNWASSGLATRVPEGLVAAEVTYRAVTSALLSEDSTGGGAHFADWQDYEVGVEVGHITTTIPAAIANTGPGESGEYIHEPVIGTGASNYRHTLTLSDLGVESTITLISQSNYQDTAVAQPFDDFTVVPFSDPSWELNVEDHESHEVKSIFTRFRSFWGNVADDGAPADAETFTPEARFQQPRARYWIPTALPAVATGAWGIPASLT